MIKPSLTQIAKIQKLLSENKNELAFQQLKKYLSLHPGDIIALKLAGAASARMQQWDVAEKFYKRIIDINENDRVAFYELSKVYKLSRRTDQAIEMLDKLLGVYPDDAMALNEIGVLFVEKGMTENSINCFSKAIHVNPSLKEAYHNLCATYFSTGKYEEAASVCRLAIPRVDEPGALGLRADLLIYLTRAGLFDEGQKEADALLMDFNEKNQKKYKDIYATVLNNCGILMMSINKVDETLSYSMQSIALNPKLIDPYINIARTYFFQEDLRNAIDWFEKALKIDPENCNLHEYLAILFRSAGRPDLALPHHYSVLQRTPESAQSLFSLGKTQFMLGDLENAYKHHEYRWASPDGGKKPQFNLPEWTGQIGEAKAVLVYREQGIGDEVIFAGCLPDLVECFSKIYCTCHPKLKKLLERSFPKIQFIGSFASLDFLPAIDVQVAFGSLGAIFRPTVESFSGKEAFLVPDAVKVSGFRDRLRLKPSRLVIGVAWRSQMKAIDRQSIYPMLEHWGPLLRVPGVTWVNLQYGDYSDELNSACAEYGIDVIDLQEVNHFDDLDSSVALMKACDLVIGPATSTTMLSAAAGVPTLRIADAADDYMLGTDYYPWLPALVPLGRSFGGTWIEPIQRAADIVRSLAS